MSVQASSKDKANWQFILLSSEMLLQVKSCRVKSCRMTHQANASPPVDSCCGAFCSKTHHRLHHPGASPDHPPHTPWATSQRPRPPHREGSAPSRSPCCWAPPQAACLLAPALLQQRCRQHTQRSSRLRAAHGEPLRQALSGQRRAGRPPSASGDSFPSLLEPLQEQLPHLRPHHHGA